jgi:hypothetical protein
VAALRSARDPLVPLGATAVEDAGGDLVAAWTALGGWAAQEAAPATPARRGRGEVAAAQAAHDRIERRLARTSPHTRSPCTARWPARRCPRPPRS